MHLQSANLVLMSLPLLADTDDAVRRQVYALLFCAYGGHVPATLYRLARASDLEVRRQASRALDLAGLPAIAAVKPSSQTVLHVTCLGNLRLAVGDRWLDGRDWSPEEGGRAGWQKVQAVFAFLLHCGVHGTPRTTLGEAVWGGLASASSLARTLTTLRDALTRAAGAAFAERALLTAGDSCRLDPDCFTSDVGVFERVFALAVDTEHAEGLAAAVPLYAQVLDLYGGPYLADVLPGNGWMLPRREMLTSYSVIAAERLAANAYERGDDWRCVQTCLRALDAEPAADDLLTWLLRAYARLGRYAELEFAYRNYLRVAGLEPADQHATQDLVARAYAEVTRARAVNE